MLVRVLVGWLAGPDLREHVLGDLEEDFAKEPSSGAFNLRLWKEVLVSAPRLMALRLERRDFRVLALTLLATLAAYVLLLIWSTFVIRPTMIAIREEYGAVSSSSYLMLYQLVRLPGILAVGTAVSYFLFRSDQSLLWNFVSRMMPLVLLLALPRVLAMLSQPEYFDLANSLARVLADCVALAIAARLGLWLQIRRGERS
jgi:hypothetical protein